MSDPDVGIQHSSARASRSLKYGVLAALTAGVLDITFALTMWDILGVPAITVLQTIASGLLGPAAYTGGSKMAAIGLLLHFAMIFVMVLVYFKFVPAAFSERQLIGGCAYGLCVWAAMNFLVVPLSAASVAMPPVTIMIADLAAHMLLVGIPIATFKRRAFANWDVPVRQL